MSNISEEKCGEDQKTLFMFSNVYENGTFMIQRGKIF
jgi:hypothetical protein